MLARLRAAQEQGEADYVAVWLGQSAGLVASVEPAADVVRRIVSEAEEILRDRLPGLLR